jgi:hypothetical protein
MHKRIRVNFYPDRAINTDAIQCYFFAEWNKNKTVLRDSNSINHGIFMNSVCVSLEPWYLTRDKNQMILTKYPWKYFSLKLAGLFELI